MENATVGIIDNNNNKPPSRSRSGKGRRKVEMKKIEKKTSLNVTFSKRRKGLFTKAKSISKVDKEKKAAVITFSPNGRPYVAGEPHVVDSLVLKYLAERKRACREEQEKRGKEGWWRRPIEGMKKEELKEFKEALIVFKSNLEARLQDSKERDQQTINFFS